MIRSHKSERLYLYLNCWWSHYCLCCFEQRSHCYSLCGVFLHV